jgi:hypothetical protein
MKIQRLLIALTLVNLVLPILAFAAMHPAFAHVRPIAGERHGQFIEAEKRKRP